MPKRAHRSSDYSGEIRGVKWDEDNLEKNEKIKAELNPRKIDEPKTPYLSPLETSDEDHDMLDGGDAGGLSPLSLDDDGQPRVRSRPLRNSAWSDSDQASPSPHTNNTHVSHSPRFSEEYYRNGSDDENSDDPEVIEKRRKFKEARNAHYKMEFMPMTLLEPESSEDGPAPANEEEDESTGADGVILASNGDDQKGDIGEKGTGEGPDMERGNGGIIMGNPNVSIL